MKKPQLFLALLLIGISVQAQKVDDILASYIKSSGGVEKMQKMKSVKLTGTGSTQQGDFPVVMHRKAPNKVKMVINAQGKEVVAQAYDGTTAWALNPFMGTTPTKLDEATAKALKEEYMEDDFINYKKKGHKVTLEGTEEIDGVKCYKVKLVKNGAKEEEAEFHYFSADTHLKVLQRTQIPSGPFKGSEAYTYLKDYREVDGIKVPYLIDQKVNGSSVFKVTVDSIEINTEVDDAMFAFPQG